MKKIWNKSLILFILIVGSLLFTFNFLVKTIMVDGKSMYPTIDHQDFLIVTTTNLDKINRFDIVEVNSKKINKKIIKRIIGLPNEKISYINDKLYINDVYIEEKFLDNFYVKEFKMNNQFFTNDFTYQLGKDEYFIMGDNRPNSLDSRILGPISSKEIFGKKGLLLFPFNRTKFIE